jgi:hypothetical protein
MIRKRYSDKDEIDQLRKENEELRRQIAILPKKAIDDLQPREKRILTFIEENPGTNKEKIIAQLENGEHIGSRMTIRKDIANLVEYGLISQRKQKNKPNSQVWELHINRDNIFLSAYRQLDNFRNSFLELIEKISEKNLQQRASSQRDDLLYHLLSICLHVIGAYFTYFVLRWPTQISDTVTQNKLYAIVIYKMVEIQSKLSEVFKESTSMPDFQDATVGEIFSPIVEAFIHHVFLLKPETIVKILEDYKKYDIHNEIIPLIDSAWKIGFPIYLYTEPFLKVIPEDLNDLQHFGVAMAHASKEYNLKISKEIWEVLPAPPYKYK